MTDSHENRGDTITGTGNIQTNGTQETVTRIGTVSETEETHSLRLIKETKDTIIETQSLG